MRRQKRPTANSTPTTMPAGTGGSLADFSVKGIHDSLGLEEKTSSETASTRFPWTGDGETTAVSEDAVLRFRHRKPNMGVRQEESRRRSSPEAAGEKHSRERGDRVRWEERSLRQDDRVQPGSWWACRVLAGVLLRFAVRALVLVLVMRGSIPVVKNMIGERQVMNTSFDR